MDLRTTSMSNSESYDKKMKSVHDNLISSKRLMQFLALTVMLNVFLTYGLIFHPPAPSAKRCAEFIKAQYPDLIIPKSDTVARSTQSSLPNDITKTEEFGRNPLAASMPKDVGVAEEKTETTSLAVRSTSELAQRDRLHDINGKFGVGALYVWPFVQSMAWWNMVAACQDFHDGVSNTINCLWGVITSVITLAVAGVKVAIWYGKVGTNYITQNPQQPPHGQRSIHPRLQDSLDELGVLIGHNVTYHGTWDHAKLGLNYSEVAMENEDPLHVFGLTSPDGMESQFSYLGNSTGNHIFKMGVGAPVKASTTSSNTNSTVHERSAVTAGHQYFAWGGVDFMVDPNHSDGGYLDYNELDWEAVLAQVSCIWGSDPTSDNLRAAAHYFQVYDQVEHGTVAGGAMSVFFGSQKSLLSGMTKIPVPIKEGSCSIH